MRLMSPRSQGGFGWDPLLGFAANIDPGSGKPDKKWPSRGSWFRGHKGEG